MIFIHICKKAEKYLTKIVFTEGAKWKWATTTEAVYNYAKKTFKENDEVDVEYTKKNGQYFVSKIMKPGSGKKTTQKSEKTSTASKENSKPTCKDCGKVLKDDKYEKCYKCNQKNPSRSRKSTYTPKDVESIKDQVALKASVEVMKVLTGQIGDVNTLIEMTKNVYKELRTLLK